MIRKSDVPIRKHTLNLFEGDYERMQVLYPRLGAGRAIREIIRAHIRQIEEATAQSRPRPRKVDLAELEKLV